MSDDRLNIVKLFTDDLFTYNDNVGYFENSIIVLGCCSRKVYDDSNMMFSMICRYNHAKSINDCLDDYRKKHSFCKCKISEGDFIYCPNCAMIMENIINDVPISFIKVAYGAIVVKLPIYGISNNNIIIKNGITIEKWCMRAYVSNIHDCIYNGLGGLDEMNVLDDQDEQILCQHCFCYDSYYILINDNAVCRDCLSNYTKFGRKLRDIYLLLGDILVVDVGMAIVRRVIDIYAILS